MPTKYTRAAFVALALVDASARRAADLSRMSANMLANPSSSLDADVDDDVASARVVVDRRARLSTAAARSRAGRATRGRPARDARRARDAVVVAVVIIIVVVVVLAVVVVAIERRGRRASTSVDRRERCL